MADKITWSQINTLYSNLNTARRKFGFSTVSIPNYQDNILKTTQIATLNNFVEQMKTNGYLQNVVTTLTDPVTGHIAKYSTHISPTANLIATIQNTCAFDSFDGFDGFDDFNPDFTCPFTPPCDDAPAFDGGFNFNFKDGFNTSGFSFSSDGMFDDRNC